MAISSGHDYEAIVIGAGVAGIYQIKRLVDLGIDATVNEGIELARKRVGIIRTGAPRSR